MRDTGSRFLKFHPELVMGTKSLDLKKIEKSVAKFGNKSEALRAVTRYINRKAVSYLGLNTQDLRPWRALFKDDDPIVKIQAESVLTDLPSMSFFATMSAYHRAKNKKIYVVQKDFFKKFEEVNLDKVQWRHLPTNMVGYVHLPYSLSDGTEVKDLFNGFYFYCGPVADFDRAGFSINPDSEKDFDYEKRNCVCFGWTDNTEMSSNYCFRGFPKDTKKSIKETFMNVTFMENDGIGNTKNTMLANGYHHHLAVMLNLLVYLKSGNPDLREFRNQITYRGNSTEKAVRSDTELSREDLTLVGFDYLKDKLRSDAEWYSMPHMGWRWGGEGRSELNLTHISGSTKKWRGDDQDEATQ